jgi:gas vesicle protein
MEEPSMNEPFNDLSSRNTSVMSGFILGALVGAGLALLMAPAPGVETRRRLGETARRLGDDANNALGRSRDALNDLKEDARTAIESGRDAFRRSRDTQPPTSSWTEPTSYSESGSRPL